MAILHSAAWFRDYIYIPLGGNRVSKLRIIVPLHRMGVNWFMARGELDIYRLGGLYSAALLFSIEKAGFEKILNKLWNRCTTCIRITNRYDRLGLLPS